MLSGILFAGVDVLCIQEVFAGDFPRLPMNQHCSYDGESQQLSLCTMESLLPKSPEFVILFQFGGESSQELSFAHSEQWPGAFTSKFGCPW